MSNDFNPYESAAPPRKKGMSPWIIILITVGVLGLISVVVCCGGAFYLGSQTMSFSKEQVVSVTESIVDIDIPEPWEPFMSFDLTALGGPVRMAMYVVDLNDESNMAMVMDMDVPAHELDNPEAFQQRMRDEMNKQTRQQRQSMESLVIVSSEDLEFSVNGQSAFATVSEAEGEDSGAPYYETIVAFHGKQHPAVLYMRSLQDDFSRDDIDAMLNSMKD